MNGRIENHVTKIAIYYCNKNKRDLCTIKVRDRISVKCCRRNLRSSIHQKKLIQTGKTSSPLWVLNPNQNVNLRITILIQGIHFSRRCSESFAFLSVIDDYIFFKIEFYPTIR